MEYWLIHWFYEKNKCVNVTKMIKCPLSVWWKPEHHFKRFQQYPHAVLSVCWRKSPSCLVYKDNVNLYKSVSDFLIGRTAQSNISRVKKVIPGLVLSDCPFFILLLSVNFKSHTFLSFFHRPGSYNTDNIRLCIIQVCSIQTEWQHPPLHIVRLQQIGNC